MIAIHIHFVYALYAEVKTFWCFTHDVENSSVDGLYIVVEFMQPRFYLSWHSGV